MFALLLLVGTGLFGYACRTFDSVYLRKLGTLSYIATSYLIFYFLTGNAALGTLGILLWFCLPWIELLTRVRALRLPIERPLRRRYPPKDDFPFLDEATEEVEAYKSFKLVEDWGCDWKETQHFFRLFYDESTHTQAAICMIDEEIVRHAYVKLTSRTKDGRIFVTWNYPFSNGLKGAPEMVLNRNRSADSFDELMESHRKFLKKRRVADTDLAPQTPENIRHLLQADQRRIVDHNLAKGLVRPAPEGTFRYSWRGLFYLWAQLVKDMVRLS